nr:hypothetical protein [Tanacetum cinerariifolium]
DLQRQAVDQLLEAGVVLVAGQNPADREFRTEVFQRGHIGGFCILELLELPHQLVGLVIVEAVMGLTDRNAKLTNLIAFFGALEGIEDHFADGFCLGHMLRKIDGVFVGLLGRKRRRCYVGMGIRH